MTVTVVIISIKKFYSFDPPPHHTWLYNEFEIIEIILQDLQTFVFIFFYNVIILLSSILLFHAQVGKMNLESRIV